MIQPQIYFRFYHVLNAACLRGAKPINMDIKQRIFVMIFSLLGCCIAKAGETGLMTYAQGFHPVILLQGGYASINTDGNTQRFIGTDDDVFTYSASKHTQGTGFGGVFVGVEHNWSCIAWPQLFMQTGIEYNYAGRININGINTVGIEPETSTTYNYSYKVKTQQILGIFKLFTMFDERFYPYGEVGLGAALNQAEQYRALTTETGSLNLTPEFNESNNTQFSYGLGFGIDMQVTANFRAGIGYRYSHFGKSSFNKGKVIFNNYQAAVSFSPRLSTYENQFMFHVSYVV
jgi:opacity protein-like surface antigen